MSVWQTPQASSRTRTSPARGSASSTSVTLSGLPNSSRTAALIFTAATDISPLELMRAMFIAMHPPKHARLKMRCQAGSTPQRIAAHEPAIRRIVLDLLDSLDGRETVDLVTEFAQPVVSRVIGS